MSDEANYEAGEGIRVKELGTVESRRHAISHQGHSRGHSVTVPLKRHLQCVSDQTIQTSEGNLIPRKSLAGSLLR